MKVAQVLHSWRQATSDWKSDLGFRALNVVGERGFSAGTVEISGGLVLIVGVNSSGKSRLLRNIHKSALGSSSFATLDWSGPAPTAAHLIDLTDLVERQVREFRVGQDFEERVDEVGFTRFNQAAVGQIAYLLGREFDEVTVAELEATADTAYTYEASENAHDYRPDVVPFFRVTRGADTTDSRQLSKGELSALTLVWVLASADAGSLLIWDEPDAFLSPYSAAHALDVIAYWTNELKSPMIASSHAFLSLANTPRTAQVMLRLHADGTTSLEKPDGYALWQALRVSPPIGVAFVVEDATSRAILMALLVEMNYEYRELSAVWIANDSSEVNSAADFPKLRDAQTTIVGVLDGDMRGQRKMSKKAIYLPTDVDHRSRPMTPELLAIAELLRDPSPFGISAAEAQIQLEALAGQNPHDKVVAIARNLAISEPQLVSGLTMNWARTTEAGRAAFAAFASEISAIVPNLP